MPRKERNYLRRLKSVPNQSIQVAARISLDLYDYIEKKAKKNQWTISFTVHDMIRKSIEQELQDIQDIKEENRVKYNIPKTRKKIEIKEEKAD
jgi:transcription antitermination factor NusA-like protein